MNILVSNDDGVDSPGIAALAEGLKKLGKVTVVAPHRERSTAGHSLTLHKPLRMREVKEGYFAVSGTPADCVYMATRHILKNKPDVIVSGINKGANLGNDIYYSGTVAAAREGAYWGVKSFAISLCLGPLSCEPTPTEVTHPEKLHWETASHFANEVVASALKENYPVHTVMNVNVPNLPILKIKGVRLSKQGRRFYSDQIEDRRDPRNNHYYWLGGEYKGFENIPGSDCNNIDEGFVSVTPLKIDSTDYGHLEEFKKWEKQIR